MRLMQPLSTPLLVVTALLALTACDTVTPPRSDPALRVHPAADGRGPKAEASPCPSWQSNEPDPFSNQPLPQFGCATRHNLAAMVERPHDLVKGRSEGSPNPEITGAAMDRYITDKTRALIDPNAHAPASTTSQSSSGGVVGALTGGLTGGHGP